MARLPRLALPGHTHLVLQRAHPALSAAGAALFVDMLDRQHYRQALFETAAALSVDVMAYTLGEREIWLLLQPHGPGGLSQLMQALGRRHVGHHHRRHGGSGTLWDGRFRAAVVEPGPWRLAALLWVDSGAGAAPPEPGADAEAHPWTHGSATQRLGTRRDAALQDPPEWWPLGNTPFEREAAYRARLAQGLPASQTAALRQATQGGWALGSAAFAETVGQALGRPAQPRARGRPRARVTAG